MRRLRIAGLLLLLALVTGSCTMEIAPQPGASGTAPSPSAAGTQLPGPTSAQPPPAATSNQSPPGPTSNQPPPAATGTAASQPPPTHTAAPAAQGSPTPAGAPKAPAPTASCGSGPPPGSLSDFPSPPESITRFGVLYYLVGRDLTVNFELVDTYGTTSGADLVSVRSESCTVNYQLRYDWIYVEYYAPQCPDSLDDFDEPESGPQNLHVVGRAFYRDGNLVSSEGSTSPMASEESGTCAGHSFRYVVYWIEITPIVPEANTLLLMGSGAAALAAWIAWKRRASGRAG